MANPIDPMVKTHTTPIPKVSRKDFVIGGILCAVYGLDELPPNCKDVSCLYLLHARGNTMESMKGIASMAVDTWNEKIRTAQVPASQQDQGFIAVCFDQRNHGTREVDKLRNEAWKSGNPNHAHDMFSIFNGTARDVSQIMDIIGSYVFPRADRQITYNLILGVSLGAHAAWHCLLHEPRIRAGVIIIGCADYISLMCDRARLSKLASWKDSKPPGSQFLGSEDFPQNLVDLTKVWDPAGLIFGHMKDPVLDALILTEPVRDPTEAEQKMLKPIMRRCFAGKKMLNVAGGSDKLVPYIRSKPFLTWFKRAIAPAGWFAEGRVSLEDIVFEGAGHEVTPGMVTESIRFICETLASRDEERTDVIRMSRM